MVSGRAKAREAAEQRLYALGITPSDLARKGGINRQTVMDFLDGKSWPRRTTLASIDRGLNWEVGTLARLASDGDESSAAATPVTEVAYPDGSHLVIGWPEDLTEDERQEWEAAVKAAAFQRAREIRASRRN